MHQVVVSNFVLRSCVLESRESCSASNFPSFVPMLSSLDTNKHKQIQANCILCLKTLLIHKIWCHKPTCQHLSAQGLCDDRHWQSFSPVQRADCSEGRCRADGIEKGEEDEEGFNKIKMFKPSFSACCARFAVQKSMKPREQHLDETF